VANLCAIRFRIYRTMSIELINILGAFVVIAIVWLGARSVRPPSD
jgi:hypothetical protein